MTGQSTVAARLAKPLEIVVCALLLLGVALFALWKMGYLSSATADEVRMTDQSRTAYVAKNLVEGRGYSTNDLPASLLDFYDERGKLHLEHWVNADRFPFGAYAIAALYLVTGSTSPGVGILLYNLIWFVGFLTFLYVFTRRLWGQRYSAVAAVGLALLHPVTYWYVYMKDADMLLLMTACLLCFTHYAEKPLPSTSWKLSVMTGSVLALLFLSRPNLGAPLVLFYAALGVRWMVRSRRDVPVGAALRVVARTQGLAGAVFIAWCVPFAIHSLREWGTPMFSANGIYQVLLGTPYTMGTNPWWKYTDPAESLTVARLIQEAPDAIVAKFTTSWAKTFRSMISTYAVELFLSFGMLAWLGSRAARATASVAAAEPEAASPPIQMLAAASGFAFLANLAVLPLYGEQSLSFRDYLGFVLPIIWITGGHAVYLLIRSARPHVAAAVEWGKGHRGVLMLAAVAALFVWNFSAKSAEGNVLFAAASKFAGSHWLLVPLALATILAHRHIFRRPVLPRLVLALLVVVLVRFQPNRDIKAWNQMILSADNDEVSKVLRQGTGVVSSLALPGEVAWLSGRRNVPAPEFVLHVYSYLFDHGLEIEDLYIESAEAVLSPSGGPFAGWAPGFEGYARLQRYRGQLPGYELVLHEQTSRSVPRFRLSARPKAATVYRLRDREAVRAMARSPQRIDLGDPASVVYTAHGFGDYYTIDGRPVVAATDTSDQRYVYAADEPYEATSTAFFLDRDHVPVAVELEVYASRPNSLQLFWNLDLYAYDDTRGQRRHRLTEFKIATPGWHKIRLVIPPGLTRAGLNKLGFRPSTFHSLLACDPQSLEGPCDGAATAGPRPPLAVARPDGSPGSTSFRGSVFVGALTFDYGAAPAP
jgi:hypothetical protein